MSYKNNPTNAGGKWSQEEDLDLSNEITENLDIATIAMNHKRTVRSITYRLALFAARSIEETGVSIEDVASCYKIKSSDIKKFTDEAQKKSLSKSSQLSINAKLDAILFSITRLQLEMDEIKTLMAKDS